MIDLFDINGNSYKRAKLIHYLHPIHTIGFNQISKLFDTSIEYKEYQLHFSTRMLKVLDHLNIEYKDVRYRFSASPAAYTEVQHFISKNNLQDKLIIMFNPFGSFKIKSFSYEQIQQLTDVLSKYDDCAMIITGEGDKLSKICCTHSNVFIGQFSSFFAAIALIDTCDLLISVDTSVVHIANGYNRKLISIYNNMMLGNFDSNYVWSPNYSNAVQVFTKENKKISDGDDIANMDLTELLSQIDIAINQIRNERLSRNQI